AGALDYVGIQRALRQEVNRRARAQPLCLALKDAHELLADDAPLLFGIDNAGQAAKEAIARVNRDKWDAEMGAKGLDHLLRLATPHAPRVHEDAGQPVADGAVDQQRRYR